MNPLEKLFRYTDTVSFEISGDITHAIERLSHIANKPILQATWGEALAPFLVGNVSKDHVRLQKVTPMFGNAFKPIFLGKFQSQNGKTSLTGTFEMTTTGRMVVGIFIFFTLAMQLLLLPGLSVDGIAVFQPTLFLIGGITFVLILKALSKGQVSWIKREIENSLSLFPHRP